MASLLDDGKCAVEIVFEIGGIGEWAAEGDVAIGAYEIDAGFIDSVDVVPLIHGIEENWDLRRVVRGKREAAGHEERFQDVGITRAECGTHFLEVIDVAEIRLAAGKEE